MRKTLAVASAAAIVLLAATPVRAHHAFSAEFDVEKKVKFKGTVTKMDQSARVDPYRRPGR
jgi:hypothetical protein